MQRRSAYWSEGRQVTPEKKKAGTSKGIEAPELACLHQLETYIRELEADLASEVLGCVKSLVTQLVMKGPLLYPYICYMDGLRGAKQ